MMQRVLMAVWLAHGCGAVPEPPPPDPRAPTVVVQDTGDDTTTPTPPLPPEPILTHETIVAVDDDPSAWLFDKTVRPMELYVSSDSVESLLEAPRTWVVGTAIIDGHEVDRVSIRLRGNLGSFQTLDRKPKLKIDFNRARAGQRFHGLEKLALNNSVGDCSYLKEATVFRVFELAQTPTPRIGFVRLAFNGEDYGLYQVVEWPDDRFLNRLFGDPAGQIYDGKGRDFVPGRDAMQLEDGIDVGLADVHGVTNAIAMHRGRPTYYDEVGAVLDWDAIHRYLAAEYWTYNWDGYTLNENNYRVFFAPWDGRAQLLVWDADNALIDPDWFTNLIIGSWQNPRGVIYKTCFDDATCLEQSRQAMAWLVDELEASTLADEVAEWAAQTDADARSDPRRNCSLSALNEDRREVFRWLGARTDVVRGELGI